MRLYNNGIDRLILSLVSGGYLDARYRLVEDDDGLKRLGAGSSSYVYEMYDTLAPEKHYAAKLIWMDITAADEQRILDTTQIQYHLSEQSDNVMRVINLWTMKIDLDEYGDLKSAVGVNQPEYDRTLGVPISVVLMEKLDAIIYKDKYGNVELLREELRTEEGVIRFAEDIGRALFTVHNNGFLHRDIKLENILWDDELRKYKLGDFGIARYVGEGDAETIAFTDGYGAPEIERQLAKSYNLTADIYSFGITLFLLLNDLQFPASDGYHPNIIQYTKDFIVPAPANASEYMAGIIRKMCSYRSSDRYQSVEEVLMDIGRIDGSYTEAGFTEYEDSPTETYREPDGQEAKAHSGAPALSPMECLNEENMNREERKEKRRSEERKHNVVRFLGTIMTAALTLLILHLVSPEISYAGRWELWIVPLAIIVEAILQKIREFHVGFGLLSVGIAVFSMHYLGIGVMQILAIVVVVIGIPEITLGTAIGMGLWIVQMLI